MIKLMGSLLIFAAGGLVWTLCRQERRRKRCLRGELAAALDRMEVEIRLNRTPLPLLLQKLAAASGSEAAALFTAVAQSVAAGESPQDSWRQAVETLQLSDGEKRALLEVGDGLRSLETDACKAMELASKTLRDRLSQLERQRPAEDRQATALCFSAAALVVILLI